MPTRKSARQAAKKKPPPSYSESTNDPDAAEVEAPVNEELDDVETQVHSPVARMPTKESGTEPESWGKTPDFDQEVVYEDTYFKEEIDFEGSGFKTTMDPELKEFLRTTCGASNLITGQLLPVNGICTYEDWKDLFVDNHNFIDLDHIYMRLGPNALGYLHRPIRNMCRLGHFIATYRITDKNDKNPRPVNIYDPTTKTFLPQAFDLVSWLSNRKQMDRAFGPRFKRASAATFAKYKDDILISKDTSYAEYSALKNISAIQYESDFDGDRKPAAVPSKSHTSKDDSKEYSNGSGKHKPPTSTVDLGNDADDEPSNGSSSSSESSSSDPDEPSSDDYSTSSTGSSISDSDESDGSNDSSSSSDSDSDDSSSSGNSTMPAGWGSKSYKPPRDSKSFMRRVKEYEKKARKRRRNGKRGKHGGKRSKRSKHAKKSKRKSSSKYSKSYLKKRGVILVTPWDGVTTGTSFEDTMSSVKNFVKMQPAMDYIVSEKFLEKFAKGKEKDYLKELRISKRQYAADVNILHTYLSAAFDRVTATRDILDKYSTRFNGGPHGVKAMNKLIKDHGIGGVGHDQRRSYLVSVKSQVYYDGYKGGVKEYVNRFQEACSDQIRLRDAKNKTRKQTKKDIKHSKMLAKEENRDNCHQLLNNLAQEPAIQPIYASAYTIHESNPGKFALLCNHIKTMALATDTRSTMARIKRSSPRMANMLHRVQAHLGSTSDIESRDIQAMLAGNFDPNDTMSVPARLWRGLDRDLQSRIIEVRNHLRAKEQEKKDQDSVETKRTTNTTVDRRANLSSISEDAVLEDDASLTDGSEDPEEFDDDSRQALQMLATFIADDLDKARTSRAFMMQVVVESPDALDTLDASYLNVYAALGRTNQAAHTTMDGGADTAILGIGHREQWVNVGRLANIVGFDRKHAFKKGLRTGTADCVIIGHDIRYPKQPFEFIARWHQAVLNPSSYTTLASAIQCQANGLIVDTVAKEFRRDVEGNMGTQRMVIPLKEGTIDDMEMIVVPFVKQNGLMTYEHRYPTDLDYDSLAVVEMTSNQPWDPRKYSESHPFARDAAGIPRLVEAFSSLRLVPESTSTVTRPHGDDSVVVLSTPARDDQNVMEERNDSPEDLDTKPAAHPSTTPPVTGPRGDTNEVLSLSDGGTNEVLSLSDGGTSTSIAIALVPPPRPPMVDDPVPTGQDVVVKMGTYTNATHASPPVDSVQVSDPFADPYTWFFNDGFLTQGEWLRQEAEARFAASKIQANAATANMQDQVARVSSDNGRETLNEDQATPSTNQGEPTGELKQDTTVDGKGEREVKGHAVHLTIDFKAMLAEGEEHAFVRSNEVDEILDDLTYEELIGMQVDQGNMPMTDTFAYVSRAVEDFHNLESLRPNFAYRAVEAIRRTFENTTQYAMSYAPFPMQRHFRAMYKWANLNRLAESISTDTVLVNTPAVGTGATCAQVFYGNVSHMINTYGMVSKSGAHSAYLDFLREEGVPTKLHRDNSGEQNDTRFRETNRELHVLDTTTEPYHPHQNPAETRAIRFLKRAGKAVMTMSGAPVEVWEYALKYVAMVNNWTSHESLDWKTPHEKRHGVQPDISPLLAYRFFEPVYYYEDDGFPNTGERLGYVLGVNDNVGSFMTFDILTDDMQSVLPRSVLRKVNDPTPNRAIVPTEDLDPVLRIQDRDLTTAQANEDELQDALPTLEPATTEVTDEAPTVLPEVTTQEDNDDDSDQSNVGVDPNAEVDPPPPDEPPDLVPRMADQNRALEREMNREVEEYLDRNRHNIRDAARRLAEIQRLPQVAQRRIFGLDGDELDETGNLREPPRLRFRDVVERPPDWLPEAVDFDNIFHRVPLEGEAVDDDDDMGLFVDEPMPMHNRKPRKKKKPSTNEEKPSEEKRKDANVRSNKKHAPSNKKRRKRRIRRLNPTQETSTDVNTHDEEYVIDDIVSHRINPRSKVHEVLIAWEGYDASHNSWEPIANIRETAEATLLDYARSNKLASTPGWEWTQGPPNADGSTADDTPSVSPPIEGGYQRTRSRTNAARRSQIQANAAQTKAETSTMGRIPTLINNLFKMFGFSGNNGTPYKILKNYVEFTDDDLKKPLPNPTIPLESATYDDPTKDVANDLAKVLELQEMDRYIEKDDEWTIVRVLKHATRRVVRRLPSKYSDIDTVKDKHTRLLVLFADGDRKWVAMDAAILQDPIPVIDYVKRNKLEKKEKFRAVREMIRDEEKMEGMRKAYKAKASKLPVFHFGVEVPRNPTHAALLDKVSENTLWADATKKELDSINSHEVFRLATKEDDLREYKRIPYQMIFDVKHDLRRKARLVAGGHMTNPPVEDVYSGVVGMNTVRLAFAVGAMQGLDVCAADISTAFLYGKTKEKLYIVAGPEFGPELEGKRLIVQGNWYGLRSAAATYHQVASAVLRKIGFRPTKVDPDLWMRKKGDHYEYLAIYVDDLLAWGKKPLDIIKEVQASFKLQGIGFPDYYLGADVNPIQEKDLQEDGCVLGLSAKTYIKNAQFKLQKLFGGGPFHKAKTPMSEHYHPEADETKLLGPEDITRYRALLGSANWIVTLGRFDIAYATSTLARFSMAPREGHLAALKRVFGYLRVFPNGELLINPRPFDHATSKPTGEIWKEYYPDASEELPPDQPEPLPKKAQITIYVDADHAHDTVTRRSVTGIMVFVNKTLVKYISKRQKTVETSSYGSELVAARVATELAMEYRYCLRMLGVEVDGPVRMFGDNNSVILNTTLPSSMLKKKHQSIAYHAVRNAQAAGILVFEHVKSEDNWADVLTKPLPANRFHALVRPLLFRRSGTGEVKDD
jgi:hypothetical protein